MAGFYKVYDYADVPTIKRFNESDKFFRCIIGPFSCLSGDTEYLTVDGWKQLYNYNITDEIAEFNPITNQIEFRKPIKYIKEPCESFLHIKNRYGIDQLLSDEHTVLFNTRYASEKWQTISALELSNKHNNSKDGWSGRIPTTFIAPNMPGLDFTDDELRLMIAISADGSFPINSVKNKCCICVRKERKKKRLRDLLIKCDIEWRERNYPSRPTETSFDFIAPDDNKLLWKYFSATEEQLKIIVDEFVYWDGAFVPNNGRVFSSIIKQNADFIQYALTATGTRATMAVVEYENKNWNTGYRVYANSGTPFLSMRQAPKIERVKSEDGYKYCFKTSTGFFVARRNGKIFITGNSGKSSGCVAEIIDRGIRQAPNYQGIRRTRWAVVRNTYIQLTDTTMKTFYQWVPPDLFGYEHITSHRYIIDKIPLDDGTKVEIEILFRALDKPEHVRNLLSLELTGAWFNEIRECPWAIVEAMEGRVKRFPPINEEGFTWSGIIADTNPPDTDSQIYKLFEERVPKDPELAAKYELFRQPSGRSENAENLKYNSADYYSNLAIGKDPEFIKVYIDGEYGFIRDGKPVFGNYSDPMHLATEPIEPVRGVPLILGFDFGMNGACVICQFLPNGKFNVIKELYEEEIGLRRFLNDIVKPYLFSRFRGWEIVTTGDPAGVKRQDNDERTSFDELRLQGFPATPARSNSWVARFNAVDVFLTRLVGGKGAFQLDPNCNMLRKGFLGEYKLKKYRGYGEDQYSEVPVKNKFSHLQDCLQYACMIADSGVIAAKGYMGSRYAPKKITKQSMSAWL